MRLWHPDIVGGVPLAGGRGAKVITEIDDCPRFVVVSAVVAAQPGRALAAVMPPRRQSWAVVPHPATRAA